MVCNHDAEAENVFINSAELAVAGRPLGDSKVYLPLSKDLVLPESLNPNEDLRTSERQRLSPETITAQKGADKCAALIASICNVSGQGLGQAPVLILNLTGYIEECGIAVPWLDCPLGSCRVFASWRTAADGLFFGFCPVALLLPSHALWS